MLRFLVIALALVAALPAAAQATAITTTTGDAKLSAAGGWLVWSEPEANAWRLVGLKDGATRTFEVPARPQPFDVDLGTDARGRIVATYTRCATYPTVVGTETGSRCRIRVLDLASGVERPVDVPHPASASDATPSMRHGRLAFSRTSPEHKQVMQVLLWTPSMRTLTRLPHGPIPTHCPYGKGKCQHERYIGSVLDLDLGERLLTYRWRAIAPAVAGTGGSTVVQALALRSGRIATLGAGVSGEACTGGIDGSTPLGPTAVGVSVWYVQLAGACEKTWAQRGRIGATVGQADLPASTIQGTTDGRWLYLTVAPAPDPVPGTYNPPQYRCDLPGKPCTIEQIAFPKLTPLDYVPQLATFN
jgi:hypothetical protein